jgi:hypothetical protein
MVPASPSIVHVGCPGSATRRPWASNTRMPRSSDSPGLMESSVGVTSRAAGGPAVPLPPPSPTLVHRRGRPRRRTCRRALGTNRVQSRSIDVTIDAPARDHRRGDDELGGLPACPSQSSSRISGPWSRRADDVELAARIPGVLRRRCTACRRPAPVTPWRWSRSDSLQSRSPVFTSKANSTPPLSSDVQPLAVAHGRRESHLHASHDPACVLVGQRALRIGRYRGHHAHLAGADVLLAVRDDDVGSRPCSAAVLRPRWLTRQLQIVFAGGNP